MNFFFCNNVFISLLTFFATTGAAVAAFYSYKTSRDSYKDNINRLFFEISLKASGNDPPTENDMATICNYFEYILKLRKENRLSDKDLELQSEIMKLPNLIKFVKSERLKHHNDEIGAKYWDWLVKNKLVE